ncbi:MAG: hypothetical protein II453_12190 [Alphaproteobacteria bacterium]|nr:hypothetical protein [Alphaproteobacteria bacterium]
MFDNVPESITRFFGLWSSSFATRHSPNLFGPALLGDFKAFARELFMSDYGMGDGGHVFRTCYAAVHPARKGHRKDGFLSVLNVTPQIT